MSRPAVLALCFFGAGSISAQVITLIDDLTHVSTFFYMPPLGTSTFDDVVNASTANDTILLPGGSFGGSVSIDKPLTIVGAGFHTNGVPVTQKTIIPFANPGGFSMTIGANGSSFHGIDFQDAIALPSGAMNISFVRCEIAYMSLDPNPGLYAVGVYFKHCVFHDEIDGGEAQSVFVDNCILDGGIFFNGVATGNHIRQSIILEANFASTDVPNVTYTNNIFVTSEGSLDVQSLGTFDHNMFALASGTDVTYGPGTFVGNQVANPQLTATNNFVNLLSFDDFDYDSDYHLTVTGDAAAMIGANGYPIGIYGGPAGSAWKENAIPFNPHWLGLDVPIATGTTGILTPVHIAADAQQD